jgi:hypothetical protein
MCPLEPSTVYALGLVGDLALKSTPNPSTKNSHTLSILTCVSVKKKELVTGAFVKVSNKSPSEIAQNKNEIKISEFIF